MGNKESMSQGGEGRMHCVTIVEARTRKRVRGVSMNVTYQSACQTFAIRIQWRSRIMVETRVYYTRE